MDLNKKKELAKRTFGIGKDRIVFVESRIADIKEAITKQDMLDLLSQGAIVLKNVSGRKTVVKKKKRSVGKIRNKLKQDKRDYIVLTRKLRKFASEVKNAGRITGKQFEEIRKKIRNRAFRSKSHMNEFINPSSAGGTK